MQPIIIRNADIELSFHPGNGAVLEIVNRMGHRLAGPAEELFTLQLLNRSGDASLLKGSQFRQFSFENMTFQYFQHEIFPPLHIQIRLASDKQFMHFRPQVSGLDAEWVLEWIDIPQICVPNDRILFQPLHDGVLIREPEARNRQPAGAYHPIAFAKRGVSLGSFFPGRAQMQFLADYDESGGLYFAAHDPSCMLKAVEYDPSERDGTRLSLQTFCGCNFGEDYESTFDYVLAAFTGNWMQACSIYRDWYESFAPPCPVLPDWMMQSPVLLIYPVRGRGLDTGDMTPNDYFPYRNILPWIEKYNARLDSSVMALLMHWEGTAPWAPPYVWPPFGGEDCLAELRDALHHAGNLLGVYCSGTAWTETSCLTAYSQTKKTVREGLQKYMCSGPKGEIDAVVCNGVDAQRFGFDLCLTEKWSRQTILEEIDKLTQFGIDYAQFFDQNLGGGANPCYATGHAHPPVPGVWLTHAMQSLMQEAVDAVKKAESAMIMGCECAAAQPFCELLPLNDARPNFAMSRGEPVPAHSFVFHGRSFCFTGNQGGIQNRIDLQNCPNNLLYRLAFSFNAGDFLSLVLKGDGKIHWGWSLSWEYPEPDQEQILSFVAHLNSIRRQYPQYFIHGRMLLPQAEVRGGEWLLKRISGDLPVPSFCHSFWQAPDRKKALVITNFLPEKQHVFINGHPFELPELQAVVLQEESFPNLKQ